MIPRPELNCIFKHKYFYKFDAIDKHKCYRFFWSKTAQAVLIVSLLQTRE